MKIKYYSFSFLAWSKGLECMIWLYVMASGSAIAITLVLSTYKVKKKKLQMYKEAYQKALKAGDMQKITDAGMDYYNLLRPSLGKDADIEAIILKDIQERTAKKDNEDNR